MTLGLQLTPAPALLTTSWLSTDQGCCMLQGFADHSLVAQVHALKQDKRMIMLELLKLQQTQEVGHGQDRRPLTE